MNTDERQRDERARMLRRVTDIYHGVFSGWTECDRVFPCHLLPLCNAIFSAFNIEDTQTRFTMVFASADAYETPEKLTDKLLSWGVKP